MTVIRRLTSSAAGNQARKYLCRLGQEGKPGDVKSKGIPGLAVEGVIY